MTFLQTSTFFAIISIYEKTGILQCFQIPTTLRTMVRNDERLDPQGPREGTSPKERD